jgi:hypothetical protein
LHKWVDGDQNEDLTHPSTKNELQQILKLLQNEKASVPNGFLVELLRGFFDIMGDDILIVVEESRTNGKILQAFNPSFITTIPKENDPMSFDKFRSISLCNYIYNIMAKVISSRLNTILLEAKILDTLT